MTNKYKKITIVDFVIITIVIASLSWAVITMIQSNTGDARLYITSCGNEFSYSLEQKTSINIKGAVGNTIIEIDYGKFRFVDSACPNKSCIHSGWVEVPALPVVCLPNRVSAIIKADKATQIFDGVSY